jgi:hypothetical protein
MDVFKNPLGVLEFNYGSPSKLPDPHPPELLDRKLSLMPIPNVTRTD